MKKILIYILRGIDKCYRRFTTFVMFRRESQVNRFTRDSSVLKMLGNESIRIQKVYKINRELKIKIILNEIVYLYSVRHLIRGVK